MALASPPRDPWEDDSDADFASAASFELDACSDAGEDSGDHRDARLPSPPASPGALVDADDDFRDCVEGLRLDDGYFAEAAYRGQPDAREGKARGGLDPGALDVLTDADLERAVSGAGEARRGASATSDYAASGDADWSAASPGLAPGASAPAPASSARRCPRAAAEAILGEHEDDRRADPTARDLPSTAHLVPADVRGAAFHDAARLSRRGDDSDSEDDRAALARLNDWEEDAGVAPAARRAKARGVVRSYVGDDHRGGVFEYSSDEDDHREAALAEARERTLAALRRDDQRAVASSRVSADAFARAVAAADVPPSDRELFLSEDVEEQHAESFFRTDFRTDSLLSNFCERDGGEGDRRGRAVERTRRDRDASPGRARPGGVRREPSSGLPPDPSRAFDPGTSSPGGEGERAREPRGGGFDPVEVRVRRFERPPPPRRGLDPENDPYRSLGPRRRRSGSAEAE